LGWWCNRTFLVHPWQEYTFHIRFGRLALLQHVFSCFHDLEVRHFDGKYQACNATAKAEQPKSAGLNRRVLNARFLVNYFIGYLFF
jgi:hypothetical protein